MSMTYNDLYLSTRRTFKNAGIEAYSLEARLIMSYVTGKKPEKLLQDSMLYTSAEVVGDVERLTARRLKGEPVAYITGSWEFYGLPLEITPDVLIPRTDTELLAETAIKALGAISTARVLDLCSGSGCVGCAISRELPGTRVVMIDISPAAVKLSRRNASLNGLNPRVSCVEADARQAPPMMIGSFDLIVCNPPYIPTADLPKLDPSVRDYEPVSALDGGDDGLDFYRAVLGHWKDTIRNGGGLLFEVGVNQAEDVKKLMRLAGIKNIGSAVDTGGIERVVWGKV